MQLKEGGRAKVLETYEMFAVSEIYISDDRVMPILVPDKHCFKVERCPKDLFHLQDQVGRSLLCKMLMLVMKYADHDNCG